MGELGVTPVALTHIGLMPAGDATSGAEPSNSQTRSFGSSDHMRTVLGAVCSLTCKMKMKVIYTGKQYIKKPTASTCWHNLAFPFTGEPHGRSRFGAGSAPDEKSSVKYIKRFKELNVFSGLPPESGYSGPSYRGSPFTLFIRRRVWPVGWFFSVCIKRELRVKENTDGEG